MWSCISASDVWTETGSPVQKWWCRELDFLDLWEEMVFKLEIKQLEETVSILRKYGPIET